jgi:hypothetical protein
LRDPGFGPTLPISPLLSLMRDQLLMAERIGVRAATINSENADEWEAVEQALAADEIDLLLVSPERLANAQFAERTLGLIRGAIGLSSSTRPTASPTGATTSAPTTDGSAVSSRGCRKECRSWPRRPRPMTAWSLTSRASSVRSW